MDCSKTINFVNEWARMCASHKIGCGGCKFNGIASGMCRTFIQMNPEKGIAILQEWSDANPIRTRTTVLLEHYPNTRLDRDGLPEEICAGVLYGFECKEGDECEACWRMPVEE